MGGKTCLAERRTARAALLFKKGRSILPENYRSISRLPVGHYIIAWMLQRRLRRGGAEGRLRPTQFGFRPRRGAVQAISIARRMFEAGHASKAPGLEAVLLDWAKAFDRIKHDASLQALRRFGMPDCMVDKIAGIYRERVFILQDPAGD